VVLLGKGRAVDNNKPGDLVTQSLYYHDILYTVQCTIGTADWKLNSTCCTLNFLFIASSDTVKNAIVTTKM